MPRPKKPTTLWATYEAAMLAARAAAFALADAIEWYLRSGVNHFPGASFHAACDAANVYGGAIRAAEPYHHATIRPWNCGAIINMDADELLDLMRELRGTAVPVVIHAADGRKVASLRYADDGIAGFYDVELRSMRLYGSPRRVPQSDATAATSARP
jgi:hypothetical protein